MIGKGELMGEASTKTNGHPGPHLNASQVANSGDLASAFGEDGGIRCVGCGKRSSKESRFCGGCGGRLWEPCPACREQNAVDLRFCGGCGGSLEASLESVVESTEKTINTSAKLAEDGRFVEAISLLEELELAPHSSLKSIGADIAKRKACYAKQREGAIAKSSVVLADVKQLMSGIEYREALARAEEIPEGIRGNELRELHKELAEKVATADRLRTELKRGLVEKQFDGLLSVADRLAMLEPKDEQVKKIAAQLRQRNAQSDQALAMKLLKAAQQALTTNNYRKAQTALDRMPEVELDESAEAVAKSARERTWLAFYVAKAPYLDEATVSLAERLAKLQPTDEKAATACDHLRKKWTESLRKSPERPAVWCKASPASQGRVLPELAESPADLAAALAGKPHSASQFVTAYGLALQAIGDARFALDLTPVETSWRSKLGLGGGKRTGAKRGTKRGAPVWGVDLGSHSLKAVCLLPGEEKGSLPVIEQVVHLPYERAADAIQSKEAIVETPSHAKAAIAKLAEQHSLAEGEVMVGAPGTLTLARFFDLPFASKSKFTEALNYETKLKIPLDPETLVIDHSTTDILGKKGVKRVALVAASRECVSERVSAFQEVGCKRVTVTSNCLAMLNAYDASYEAMRSDGKAPTIAYVSVGAKATNFVVRSNDHYWFRGLYYGSDGFDRRLMREAHFNWPTVEKLRRKPGKATWCHEIDKVLTPKYQELVELIERTISQFRTDEGQGIDQVLLSGGGALQFGLLCHLRSGT